MALSDEQAHAALVALFFCFFWLIFVATWALSARYSAMFQGFAPHQKADWCSRMCSTVHAGAITVGIVCCLVIQPWSATYEPDGPLSPLIPACLCYSVAFFLCDLVVLLSWQIASWTLFVVHHVVALIPYCIMLFIPDCQHGIFVLTAFLFVELSTVPLNAAATLEQLGYLHTAMYRAAFLTMYLTWAVARVVWPAFLMDIVYEMYILRPNFPTSLFPALICAHIIAAFCWFVFFFHWTPELIRMLRGPVAGTDEAVPLMEPREAVDEEQPAMRRSFDDMNVLNPIHRWENNMRLETLAQPYPTTSPPLVAGAIR